MAVDPLTNVAVDSVSRVSAADLLGGIYGLSNGKHASSVLLHVLLISYPRGGKNKRGERDQHRF